MSFWTKSDGSTLNKANTTNAYEDKNNFEPIPSGTTVVAAPTEVKWDEYEGVRYISVRWDVIDGQYKGRVIFQKLHVCSAKDAQRNRALDMFAVIAKNAGGSLLELDSEPTNVDLSVVIGKPMSIHLLVWDMNGKSGNWIDAASGLGAVATKAKTDAPAGFVPPKQQPKIASASFDDDIPF